MSTQVKSYGVGGHVKLPGPSAHQPNVFAFGTPYSDMHQQLQKADQSLYTRNGILPMLERNMSIKRAPERWQDSRQVLQAHTPASACIAKRQYSYGPSVQRSDADRGADLQGAL